MVGLALPQADGHEESFPRAVAHGRVAHLARAGEGVPERLTARQAAEPVGPLRADDHVRSRVRLDRLDLLAVELVDDPHRALSGREAGRQGVAAVLEGLRETAQEDSLPPTARVSPADALGVPEHRSGEQDAVLGPVVDADRDALAEIDDRRLAGHADREAGRDGRGERDDTGRSFGGANHGISRRSEVCDRPRVALGDHR